MSSKSYREDLKLPKNLDNPEPKLVAPQINVIRSGSSQPLKDLNYSTVSNPVSMSKPVQNSSQADKTGPKQKISLEEYRKRAKSKSPNKPGDDVFTPQNTDVFESDAANTLSKNKATSQPLVSQDVRECRAMSVDEVLDVSTDLANMSIDRNEAYLDEKSGEVMSKSERREQEKASIGQTLPKAISSSEIGSRKDVEKSVPRASKSSSTLVSKGNDEKGDKVFDLSLSDRLKMKSSNKVSYVESKKESGHSSEHVGRKQTDSDDCIDLTQDEETERQPVHQKHSQVVRDKAPFQSVQKQPMQSFESLNKAATKTNVQADQSQQWTQMRAGQSANQDFGFKPASRVELERSLKEDVTRRNELMRLLDKQKQVVSVVKMSELPDKGERLKANLEDLANGIRNLTTKIIQKQAKLKEGQVSASGVQSGSSSQPRVVKVYPDGSQVNQGEGVTSSQTASTSQPQVIKIYPNGTRVVQPGVVGGNHLPHNPDNMRQTTLMPHISQIPPHILQQMYSANPQAMQLYGGRMTTARLREVGSVTKEAIERLHKQLETCPKPTEELEDPKGVIVPLMVHQRQALTWLVWRERQSPSGGILADDMGLGKTLTMISLILKQNELKRDGSEEDKSVWMNRDKQLQKMDKSIIRSNATFVICPASLIHQWRTEIERRCSPGLLRVCMYHGPNREQNVLKLANYDVVLTTYNIVSKEVDVGEEDKKGEEPVKDDDEKDDDTKETDGESQAKGKAAGKKQPNIMRIAWERIILDEAHNIKNHKSLQSRAVIRLRAGFRWALTGTPIQNDLLDMYSLLRFLRCSPFDEYKVWKRQVDTRNMNGQNRLNVLVKSLLLRRTKTQTGSTGKPLVPLPDKCSRTHELKLSAEEKQVYDRIYDQSRSVLKEYLKKHEDKELERDGHTSSKQPVSDLFTDKNETRPGIGQTAGTMNEGSTAGGVKGQQILVMLLRLRQCCCHLSLMKDALDDETQSNEGLELTLEEQMMDLMLDDAKTKEPTVKKSSPIFTPEAVSTKIHALVEELKKIHKPENPKDKCKSVIVSQWTKMLEIVTVHLKRMNVKYSIIKGDIPPKKRMEAVDLFNNDPEGPQVMLVSLRAGGCGLNLIGGNHLFLLDSHWNPALEDQASDRIYRVGQQKNVFVHRFLCKDTVEEKIVELQKKKQTLAKNVLSGSATNNTKLTLADLRLLFNV